MNKPKIIVTTPDFPPKLGGLSSFSRNLVELFESSGWDVEVRVWSSPKELILQKNQTKEADLFVHVHYLAGILGGYPSHKSVNFCHGSEILLTSPNPVKKLVKKLTKFKTLNYFESCLANLFISQFTMSQLERLGLNKNHSRDFVIHNCIPATSDSQGKNFSGKEGLKFCAIARDVPHKNLGGVYEFSKLLSKISGLEVELSLTSDRFSSDGQLKVIPLIEKTDEELKMVYKDSHLNLLLSKDDSSKGFFEGFGLTTLEAAEFSTPSIVSSTGGLPENVHHGFNGFVFEEISEKSVQAFYKAFEVDYENWSLNCGRHLSESHGMIHYHKFFSRLLGEVYE